MSGTAAVLQNPAAQLSPPRPLALLPASQSPSVKLFEETGLTLAPRTQVGDFAASFQNFPLAASVLRAIFRNFFPCLPQPR